MTAPATALSVEKVTVHFGGLVALSDMNFSVGEGEIVGLIGPNGAGKTTAFNVITGFLDLTHGAVSYRGTALNGLKPHQIAGLGLIRTFQRTSVFPNDTVYDNLLIGRIAGQGWPSEAILGLPRAFFAAPRRTRRTGRMGWSRTPCPRPCGLAVLRRTAACRRGACVGGRTVDVVAGRAGLRHERLGNPHLRAADPEHQGSRCHHPARRARHADGDERLGSDRGAELRSDHRRGGAGRVPEQSGRHRSLSRARSGTCLNP